MNAPESKHILLFPVHIWGHTRPMCTLAARLVQLESVTVTFFVAASLYERIKAEVARDFDMGAQDPRLSGLRFVVLEQGNVPHDPEVIDQSFMSLWGELLSGREVACSSINGVDSKWKLSASPPDAIVLDIFATCLVFDTFHEQRHTWNLPRPLKLFSWLPVTTSWALVLHRQNLIPMIEDMVSREGITFGEAAYDLLWTPKGKVLTSPCLPPLYDYECHPQAMPILPNFVSGIFAHIGRKLENTDGVITFDAADYNPKATTALRDWFAQTSRPVCYAGPLVPSNNTGDSASSDATSEGVAKFLDNQLAIHGAKSVIYVSFGSMLWPSDPAKLDAVLDVLMAKHIPVVITHPSAAMMLLPETRRKLVEYDGAFSADWIPQQAVLDHPAVGWCLTHGGHNSVLECILTGVPMIVWPIVVDQPMNAVHLSANIDVAYELVEVRHGSGLGPICRTGKTPSGTLDAVKAEFTDVLDRAFGKDGEEKRARLQTLKATLEGAWKEDGVARRDVRQLLEGI
ncbi:hypothetical protein VTO73DRAFT_12100 [Trametes versicolor]